MMGGKESCLRSGSSITLFSNSVYLSMNALKVLLWMCDGLYNRDIRSLQEEQSWYLRDSVFCQLRRV